MATSEVLRVLLHRRCSPRMADFRLGRRSRPQHSFAAQGRALYERRRTRVTAGLAAGTRIVTAGIHSLKPGQKSALQRMPTHEVVQPFRLGAQTPFARLVFHDRLHGGGFFAYLQLGREEDPDFTIKTMVIQAQWPGASAEEVTRQVTDRIEKKLEELEILDYTKSVTVAGQTTVLFILRDSTKAE